MQTETTQPTQQRTTLTAKQNKLYTKLCDAYNNFGSWPTFSLQSYIDSKVNKAFLNKANNLEDLQAVSSFAKTDF
jgi:hypothetical protein